jgi:hypothetical protein
MRYLDKLLAGDANNSTICLECFIKSIACFDLPPNTNRAKQTKLPVKRTFLEVKFISELKHALFE